MGEIADMMLDGTLCEGCGVYIDGEAQGFPRYCSKECAAASGFTPAHYKSDPNEVKKKMVACPTCGKRVQKIGLANHMKDAHK